MILIINYVCQSKKKITIVEVYYTIDVCINNVDHFIIIIKLCIYVFKYMYLSDLNFYLGIADLYIRFDTDFVFPKTKEYSCHQFYSIYYSFFFLYILSVH